MSMKTAFSLTVLFAVVSAFAQTELETARWQAAIDAAAAQGGGTVVVPAGVHPVGQLELKSNVELRLEKGAVLEGAAGMENYRVVTLPYSEGTWSAVVAGFGVTNVAITGEGEINGRGERFSMDFRNAPKGVCTEGLRPRGIVFADSAQIQLADFTLRDAACWGIVLKCCRGVDARRVKIDSHAHWNNDGFDVEAADVLIEDCDVDAGDDAICLKANNPGFTVENVVVRNCRVRSHCNGLKIGTASHGTIRDVRFERCRLEAPRRDFISRVPGEEGRWAHAGTRRPASSETPAGVGISAICVECVDGGTVEGIVYDDIDVGGFLVPIFVRGGSRSGRKCGIQQSDRFVLRDILIRKVRGRAVSTIPSSVSGVDVCRPTGVRLEDIDIVCRGEGEDSRPIAEPGPEFAGRYPEATMFKRIRLPAFGLYVDRADAATLKEIRFTLAPGEKDARPPVFVSSKGNPPDGAREGCHAWVDINTNAFAQNIRAFREIVGKGTKVCAIMKADAYGNGIRTLMPEVINTGVECVGIAGNDDARAARAAGYRGRLVRVRMATCGEIRNAFGLEVEELVGSLAFAREVDSLAAAAKCKQRIHLALNAGGMDRNGLDMSVPGSLDEAVAICALPHLEVVAMMTHFPVEDAVDIRPGLARFRKQVDDIVAAAHLDRSKLTVHAANSYASLHVPEARLDMCRPGSVFYMDYDPDFPCFKTIFSFKTRVAAVHSYPKGSTVCYDRTYRLTRDSRLANLPVGYADGYVRAFGNKGHVLVRGHKVPIVGVVSMNTCLADVTDFPDVVAGDEVVLYGRQGTSEISVKEIEETSGMPIYAIMLLWGRLNPQFAVCE